MNPTNSAPGNSILHSTSSFSHRASAGVASEAAKQQHSLYSLKLLQGFFADSAPALTDLSSALQTAGTLRAAFQNLPALQQEEIQKKVGERRLQEILSISEEPNPAMFWASALQLGVRLKQDHQLDQAGGVLAVVSKQGATDSLRNQATAEMDSILGKGSGGMRAEFLLSRLAKDATSAEMIVPMVGASFVGHMVGAASLGRLARLGEAWYSRGFGVRFLAGSAAYAAEFPAFALAGRALSPIPHGSLTDDMQRSALTLGALRIFGFAGNQAFLKVHGFNQMGIPAQLSGFTKFSQAAIPQASMFAGLIASHKLEEQLGLRQKVDGATTFIDTFGSLVSLGVGSHLGRRALGPRFAALQHEMNFRANVGAGLVSALSKDVVQGSGGPMPVVATAGRWRPPVADAPTGESLAAPVLMAASDGNGGGGYGKKTGFFAAGTGIGKPPGGEPPAGGSGKPPSDPPGDSRMDASYTLAGAIVRDKLGADGQSALAQVKEKDLVVIPGTYDHIERVLKALGVPYTTVPSDHISEKLLEGAKFVFVNCSGGFPTPSALTLGRWVEAGGLMMTTDWALKHVLEVAFRDPRGGPLYVRHNGRQTGGYGGKELVGITEFKQDDPGIAGYWNQGEPQWWLEPSSYPIEILDQGHVEVLARSAELGKRYGADPVILRFNHGKGGVIHMISHFYLQHGGPKLGEIDAEASAYATSMGASAQVIDQVKHTARKTGATAGTVRSATSSLGFMAGTITSHIGKAGQPTGGQPPIPPAPPAAAEPSGKQAATATPGVTMIGKMMGIVGPSGQVIPVAALPSLLPWKPDIKTNWWKWNEGVWHFQMPAAPNEMILGRQGNVLIIDPRDIPTVSRKHARIKRLVGGGDKDFNITALYGDVSIWRPDQEPLYLQANRQTGEGESSWLLPGDRVKLTPEVEFIFDPQALPKPEGE